MTINIYCMQIINKFKYYPLDIFHVINYKLTNDWIS